MGEVIQLQGDQRKDVQEFLVDKKEGLELDAKTIKVSGLRHLLGGKSPSNGGDRCTGSKLPEPRRAHPLPWTDRR